MRVRYDFHVVSMLKLLAAPRDGEPFQERLQQDSIVMSTKQNVHGCYYRKSTNGKSKSEIQRADNMI